MRGWTGSTRYACVSVSGARGRADGGDLAALGRFQLRVKYALRGWDRGGLILPKGREVGVTKERMRNEEVDFHDGDLFVAEEYVRYLERAAKQSDDHSPESSQQHMDPHEQIARQVFRRLRLRHMQLLAAEHEARQYAAHLDCMDEYKLLLKSVAGGRQERSGTGPDEEQQEEQSVELDEAAGGGSKEAVRAGGTNVLGLEERARELGKRPGSAKGGEGQSPSEMAEQTDKVVMPLNPGLRAYHLAVTDLFVEKAIAYLEDHADAYSKRGDQASRLALWVTIFGAVLALALMLLPMVLSAATWVPWLRFLNIKQLPPSTGMTSWDFAQSFTKAFTAYGMLVLVTVLFWRHGKANLDQAERLMERRHALRQGRLFVHLNDGKLTIDQMDKAFNWNYAQSNAFANMKDDAQAPWGAVTKELARSAAELVRAAIQATVKQQTHTDSKEKE